jgi:hypothetical protein
LLTDGREGMNEEAVIELADEGARLGCHHCLGVLLSLPVTAPSPPQRRLNSGTKGSWGTHHTPPPMGLQLPPLSPNVSTSMCATLLPPPSPQAQACADEAERMLAEGRDEAAAILQRFSTGPCS